MGCAPLTARLRRQTPELFAPVLRGIATSVDPTLRFNNVGTLDAKYRAYSRSAVQLALVIALISGSVFLLSAGGITHR